MNNDERTTMSTESVGESNVCSTNKCSTVRTTPETEHTFCTSSERSENRLKRILNVLYGILAEDYYCDTDSENTPGHKNSERSDSPVQIIRLAREINFIHEKVNAIIARLDSMDEEHDDDISSIKSKLNEIVSLASSNNSMCYSIRDHVKHAKESLAIITENTAINKKEYGNLVTKLESLPDCTNCWANMGEHKKSERSEHIKGSIYEQRISMMLQYLENNPMGDTKQENEEEFDWVYDELEHWSRTYLPDTYVSDLVRASVYYHCLTQIAASVSIQLSHDSDEFRRHVLYIIETAQSILSGRSEKPEVTLLPAWSLRNYKAIYEDSRLVHFWFYLRNYLYAPVQDILTDCAEYLFQWMHKEISSYCSEPNDDISEVQDINLYLDRMATFYDLVQAHKDDMPEGRYDAYMHILSDIDILLSERSDSEVSKLGGDENGKTS